MRQTALEMDHTPASHSQFLRKESMKNKEIKLGLNTEQSWDHQSRHNDLPYVNGQAFELIHKIQKARNQLIAPPKETRRLLDLYNRS